MSAKKKKRGFFDLNKKPKNINLLPQEEFTQSTWGRVLTWLMSTFRIIVITTEMVVMGAFLSRFWLDAISSDLNDEIAQKQVILESYSDFEKTFRTAQEKLAIFANLTSTQKASLPSLQSVFASLPEGTAVSSVTLTEDEAEIKARAHNEQDISQFIVNLGNKTIFDIIEIENVKTEPDGTFLFSLRGALKKT